MENDTNIENENNLPLKIPLGIRIISFLPSVVGVFFLFIGWSFGRNAIEVEVVIQFLAFVTGIVFMLIQIPIYFLARKRFSSKATSVKSKGSLLMFYLFIFTGLMFAKTGVEILVQGAVFGGGSFLGIFAFGDNILGFTELITGISIVSYFVLSVKVRNFYQLSERLVKWLKIGFVIILISLFIYGIWYFINRTEWKNYIGTPQQQQDITARDKNTQEIGVKRFDDVSESLGLERVMNLDDLGLSGDQLGEFKSQPFYYKGFDAKIEIDKNHPLPRDTRFLRKGNIKLFVELSFPYGDKGVDVVFAPMLKLGTDPFMTVDEFGQRIRALIDSQGSGLSN